MRQLILICGISGSGKSFYAAELNQAIPNSIIISSDAIRGEVTGSTSDMSKDNIVWNKVIPERLIAGLAAGKIVIFDATGTHPKARRKIIDIGIEGWAEIHCHYFEPDIDRAKRQNALRGDMGGRRIPHEVIDRQAKQWKTPALSEGFDSILNIDSKVIINV